MARRFTFEILKNLATAIGANPSKWTGTRTNVTFLGKGLPRNPLFQEPLAGIETATESQLGSRGAMIEAVEDAMGFYSAGKLNTIQTEILGKNLSAIKNIYKPPVLPSATVTDIAPGIEGLRRFPKETHKFFGRPLKDKDFSEIDRLTMEGKIPDARGRRWDFKTPGTAVDASGLKLAKPPKESSRSFLEMMADRGHKVLKPGTPEYEAYMKKGLRTFPGGRLPEPGPGEMAAFSKALNQKTGMSRAIARNLLLKDTRLKLKPEELFMLKEGKGEPLDLMRKYYGRSMSAYDDFLDNVNLEAARPDEFAEMILKNVKLVPQFAEGGLAEILQAPKMKHGGRIGFKDGTYRDRLQKDYESLTSGADWMRTAPPKWWLFPEKYGMTRDDAMTFFKERFMYGDLDPIPTPWEAIKQSPELVKFKKWLDEREGHATGGVSNLFRRR